MKAGDIMTAPVVTIRDDATVADAVKLMIDHRVSGLPVVDAGNALVGMLTEGDLLRRAELGTGRKRARWVEILLGPGREADDFVREHGRRVAELMTERPACIADDADISEVVALMEKRHVKRVPVVRGGKLAGVVARADVIRALASPALEIAPASDKEIRERIIAALRGQKWAPTGLIAIDVARGEATLSGAILDERERNALRVLAENTPGVTKVHDRLVWIGPEGLYVEPPKE
ncbi:MAG TPA: CBS domain-containing protein [Rhodoblastus sp.]|nr:CBS domain-containing protein [Rhodoblastus sp.]